MAGSVKSGKRVCELERRTRISLRSIRATWTTWTWGYLDLAHTMRSPVPPLSCRAWLQPRFQAARRSFCTIRQSH